MPGSVLATSRVAVRRAPTTRLALKRAANERRTSVFETELGWMALVMRGDVLAQLTFGYDSPRAALAALDDESAAETIVADRKSPLIDRLRAYARGEEHDFSDIQIELAGATPFERRVVALCRRIPFGGTLTYGQLAARAGSPLAARAVGNVMRTNRCPLVVPCHRVVPATSGLGGYSAAGGVRMKLRLLEMEALGRV
jgi:methylated-DNA-[protein]-cysteine S-methyltransferase